MLDSSGRRIQFYGGTLGLQFPLSKYQASWPRNTGEAEDAPSSPSSALEEKSIDQADKRLAIVVHQVARLIATRLPRSTQSYSFIDNQATPAHPLTPL
jgi:hypothetical protein